MLATSVDLQVDRHDTVSANRPVKVHEEKK